MAARGRKPPPEKSGYVPTARELAAIDKLRKGRAGHAPGLKISKQGGITSIAPNHPNTTTGLALLMEALGSTDQDFLDGFLNQLVKASLSDGAVSEHTLNFLLSVVKGIEPRDQVEAMLAAQMAAVHTSLMTFARRLANVENIPQQDSAERAFNKLARTFANQMEALKRYRTGGEQKVTVQHVTVGEGGQAIVGNVTQGEAAPPKAATAPLAITESTTAPMPIIESRLAAALARSRPTKKK